MKIRQINVIKNIIGHIKIEIKNIDDITKINNHKKWWIDYFKQSKAIAIGWKDW